MKLKWMRVAATGFVVALPLAGGAAELVPTLQLSTGVDYSSGDYGQSSSTEVIVVPVSAKLVIGAWSLKASLPYVTVSGPANVSVIVDGSGGSSPNSGSESPESPNSGSGRGATPGGSDTTTPTPTTGGTVASSRRSASGIGDASLALTYSINDIASSAVYADLTGRVKFSTGSEGQGLGSGATDTFATSELGWDAGGGGLFVNGGRRFLGSTATVPRRDGWQWGAGGWLLLNPALDLGLSYNGRQGATTGAGDSSAVEGSVTLRLAEAWQVTAYGGAGLSKASADYAGGLNLIWHANGRRR